MTTKTPAELAQAAAHLALEESRAVWETAAREAWIYGDQLSAALPVGGPNDGLLERILNLRLALNEAKIAALSLPSEDEK